MRRLRFGIAGLRDTKDLAGTIKFVAKEGFAACEVQFVTEFTLKETECKRLGDLARDAGIALSVHAHYFASLTTKEPDRIKLHCGALHHAGKLAQEMGARIVVCHAGSREDADTEELTERVDKALEFLTPRFSDLDVLLGLETPGRKSQFGHLHELMPVISRHPFTTPVIDFAHVHAVLGGRLKTVEAFEEVFGLIADNFTSEHLWPLHCHFNDNRFGDAGEISHVPYGQGSLRIGNLVKAAEKVDLALTVISEEKDLESHREILQELRKSNAPLVGPKEKTPLSNLPEPIPLEPKGPSHIFRKGKREVRLTNLDKVFFPEDGYTKGDLIDHYYRTSPFMLPFLRDRPIVMQRVPDGIDGEAFYEKQAPKGRPEWIRTVAVPSDGGTKKIDYVVVDDVPTLIWLAQIASVECHAWTSRWPAIEQPDFAVLDLDPHEPITFDDVRAVAKLVRVVLEKLGLVGFPKTSGGAGLQVFIPLVPGHTYQEVREFCSAIGQLIVQAYPEKATLAPSKPKRAGKVYVDANQNAKGKTLVAPYSVRPYPRAPVSTPLSWEELDEEFFPEEFTITTITERLEEIGDPFRRALLMRQDLHPALDQLT